MNYNPIYLGRSSSLPISYCEDSFIMISSYLPRYYRDITRQITEAQGRRSRERRRERGFTFIVNIDFHPAIILVTIILTTERREIHLSASLSHLWNVVLLNFNKTDQMFRL